MGHAVHGALLCSFRAFQLLPALKGGLYKMSGEEASPSTSGGGAGRAEDAAPPKPQNPVQPALSQKKLLRLKLKQEHRGIVYISRIPPHLVSGGRAGASHMHALSGG